MASNKRKHSAHSYKHRGKTSLHLSHLVNLFTEISRKTNVNWLCLKSSTTGQWPLSPKQILLEKNKNVWRMKLMFRNYPNNVNISLIEVLGALRKMTTDESKHDEAPGQEMLHVDVGERWRDKDRAAKAGRTAFWFIWCTYFVARCRLISSVCVLKWIVTFHLPNICRTGSCFT